MFVARLCVQSTLDTKKLRAIVCIDILASMQKTSCARERVTSYRTVCRTMRRNVRRNVRITVRRTDAVAAWPLVASES